MKRSAAALLGLAVLVAGCSDGDLRVTGTVLGVDGDLTTVRSFQVLTPGGERLEFEPAADLSAFADGTPLTHLSEHLQTGAPIRVTYRVEDDKRVAVVVEDAP